MTVTPTPVPEYASIAWLHGRRLSTAADPKARAAMAEAVSNAADARRLSPAALHGAYDVPLGGGGTELVIGAVLNGAPIVRDSPEMRGSVLSRVHRAVAARMELSSPASFGGDEEAGGEASWSEVLADVLDEVEASDVGRALGATRVALPDDVVGGVRVWDDPLFGDMGWHLVARASGRGGAVFYGTVLPNPGSAYREGAIETVECTDETGAVIARLVGARVLEVSAERPIATLRAPLDYEWTDGVLRRIEQITGKFRPCELVLYAPA